MSHRLAAGLLAAALVAVPALAAGPDFEAVQWPNKPPKSAPGSSLPDLDGKARSLAESTKSGVLFFWATW